MKKGAGFKDVGSHSRMRVIEVAVELLQSTIIVIPVNSKGRSGSNDVPKGRRGV